MTQEELDIESALFLQIADGDERAFTKLFERYARLLYPFLFNIAKSSSVAEECIQETMLRVWLKRDSLPDIRQPRSWVFRIASNLAFTHLQKKLSADGLSDQIGGALSDSSVNIEENISLKQLRETVQEAVQQLPRQRKLIYQMSRDRGLTRAEIAAQLHLSEKTVKNSLHAALKFIRVYLEQRGYLLPLICLLFS